MKKSTMLNAKLQNEIYDYITCGYNNSEDIVYLLLKKWNKNDLLLALKETAFYDKEYLKDRLQDDDRTPKRLSFVRKLEYTIDMVICNMDMKELEIFEDTEYNINEFPQLYYCVNIGEVKEDSRLITESTLTTSLEKAKTYDEYYPATRDDLIEEACDGFIRKAICRVEEGLYKFSKLKCEYRKLKLMGA